MVPHDKELEMDMAPIIETNRQWMEQRQRELQAKEAELARLAEECEGIRHELTLMARWLERVTGQSVSGDKIAPAASGEDKPEGDGPLVPKADTVTGSTSKRKGNMELRGDRLRDEVAAMLREAYPDALYYRDILEHLQNKGYKVSGKDPGLNLIAHLTHDDRFERGEKRGYYLLSANYANK